MGFFLRCKGTPRLRHVHTAFLATVLKDIRSERAKITEKDNLRLLFVTKWFLDFFLSRRTQAKNAKSGEDLQKHGFGLVAEVLERHWIIWVLRRMREAVDDKVTLHSFICANLIYFSLCSSLKPGPNFKQALNV